MSRLRSIPAIIIPGFLIAATGVGAGDLATAGIAGMRLGTSVLWAILLGAALKFVLTEGLARYQLVTGRTLLHGAVERLGPALSIGFAVYLVPWTFVVGAALMSACGVTAAAMLPLFEDATTNKIVWGAAHSIVGVCVVWRGSFRVFERVMMTCVGVMFVAVIVTALRMSPDWAEVLRGCVVPTIPHFETGGLDWTIALLGGVGGTVTILCYGYWIREAGRTSPKDINTCRVDLAVGYVATALFGMAMLIIASGAQGADGTGVGFIIALADRIDETLGSTGRWIFLIGAWAAVFSSLLGVWQSVPYLIADFIRVQPWHRDKLPDTPGPVDVRSAPYRTALLALAFIPLVQLFRPFDSVQKVYAIIGAFFMPLLAIVLVILGRRSILGSARHRPLTVVVLVATVLVFVLASWFKFK